MVAVTISVAAILYSNQSHLHGNDIAEHMKLPQKQLKAAGTYQSLCE